MEDQHKISVAGSLYGIPSTSVLLKICSQETLQLLRKTGARAFVGGFSPTAESFGVSAQIGSGVVRGGFEARASLQKIWVGSLARDPSEDPLRVGVNKTSWKKICPGSAQDLLGG